MIDVHDRMQRRQFSWSLFTDRIGCAPQVATAKQRNPFGKFEQLACPECYYRVRDG
jgi:hypothetical protein